MYRRWLIALLCLVSLLAACKARDEAAASPSPAAIAAATHTPFVATVTPAPSASLTRRPADTPAPVPTFTPSFTPTPMPTVSFWDSYAAGTIGEGALYPLRVVNQIGGRVNQVIVAETLAYVAVGPRIWTLDVSHPETPVASGQTDILP